MTRTKNSGERGLSMIELMIVLLIIVVITGVAVPNLVHANHTSKIRGVTADLSTLIENQRLYAIRDNRFYSIRLLTTANAPTQAYIDMFPKSGTGASGNGGTSIVAGTPGVTGDPVIELTAEVTQQAVADAPNTANLESQLLPANTVVTPTDASASPITFSPRGLPCATLSVTGGSVCDSSGGPVAFWTFFTSSSSEEWDAITVTPAGRIQRWYYTGSVWKNP